jgi:5-oxoprolinase (ATP-hydrolysing)
MLRIHTVAAGGGSVCRFDGGRQLVGPASAGAVPGPAAYRRGGPLTVTDCNVALGKVQPEFFPAVFGPHGDQPLDREAALARLGEVAAAAGLSPEACAEGLVTIAVANMANAIKSVSIARGHDVTRFTLASFGGAGGQHACLVADALGIETVMIHPLAGVLSAYGIGIAARREVRERTVELPLDDPSLDGIADALGLEALDALGENARLEMTAHLRTKGSDSTIEVPLGEPEAMREAFAAA